MCLGKKYTWWYFVNKILGLESSLVAQEIKNPAIITAVAWVPSLSQKLLRATSTAKTKQTKKTKQNKKTPRQKNKTNLDFILAPKACYPSNQKLDLSQTQNHSCWSTLYSFNMSANKGFGNIGFSPHLPQFALSEAEGQVNLLLLISSWDSKLYSSVRSLSIRNRTPRALAPYQSHFPASSAVTQSHDSTSGTWEMRGSVTCNFQGTPVNGTVWPPFPLSPKLTYTRVVSCLQPAREHNNPHNGRTCQEELQFLKDSWSKEPDSKLTTSFQSDMKWNESLLYLSRCYFVLY